MATAYRADHVGSLLRPAELLRARQGAATGQLSPETLRAQEDAAIMHVLERQQQLGVPIFTDGELRRGSWITDLAESVDGFVPQSRTIDWRGPGGGPEPSTSSVVGGRLRPKRRLTGDQTVFLKAHAPGPIKMTLPAPSNFWVVSWKAGVSDVAYASRSEMLQDVVHIVRNEIEALIADGVDYVQLDAPFYGVFIDEQHRATLRQTGVDPDRALAEVVAADNAVVEGLARAGLTLALHICRGNRAAAGSTRAATTRLPKRCSPAWPSTRSSSSTTRSGMAALSRCAIYRRARPRCSGWSRPRTRRRNPRRDPPPPRPGGARGSARSAGIESAVWFCVGRLGQLADRGRSVAEARSGRADGARRLGLRSGSERRPVARREDATDVGHLADVLGGVVHDAHEPDSDRDRRGPAGIDHAVHVLAAEPL